MKSFKNLFAFIKHKSNLQDKERETRCAVVHEAKAMHEHLSEHQIDKTRADSFPVSDPLAWY